MSDRLRVGVDAWNLPHDRRGIGRYLRALLDEFAGPFADQIACTLVVPEWPAWTVASRYRTAANGHRFRVRSRRAAARAGLDLLWFPFNGMSWEPPSLPTVATLHDASTFVLPGYGDDARAPFLRAARTATRIITDSRYCADELARVLHYPRERIDPIPLAVAPALPPRPVALDIAALGRFVLFVGESEPRKGLYVLGDAVERLRASGLEVGLVVVGHVTPQTHIPRDVTVLGHVDDATLAALYRACAVFAYPSRYEGFGLPVLEAMSYGAPVVASRATAIPEAGGDAALYVPPDDPEALAMALARVLCEDGCAGERRGSGLARAEAMTWPKTAAATIASFRRALDDRK